MEQIKEFIRSLVFSKEERQKRKELREEFARNVQTGESALSKERSEQLLNILHVKIAERKSGVLFTATLFKWSAAAAILVLAGSFWKYYRPLHAPATAQSPIARSSPEMIVKANNSTHILSLTLPDKSVVLLSPGSTINYYAFFEPGHRNIHLSGMAVFEVAGDAGRPFTVNAGDINTTALGTRFMMSTMVAGKVQVRLLEGKVVVRSSGRTLALKDVYLLPGQQFTMDRQSNLFAVTEYKDSTGMTVETRKKTTMPSSSGGHSINTSILEFNQEPLTVVLKKIGLQYGVVFRLNGHGFDTIQVTGKFLPSDSLQSVLSMLGAINELSFTENNDTIVVAHSLSK
jgi:ferric-dicitrate binding protein FerR (iron transport regulator)